MTTSDFLPVTVDKSHLITIGERLYTESIELIRELVNNAYDADATEVRVAVSDDPIQVEDNGAGVDVDGLRQYFNIGSPEKLQKPKSPRFRRDRIGQFGIGKFASLSACERFEVETQKGPFAARVIFDKSAWEQAGEAWQLPFEYLTPDAVVKRLRLGHEGVSCCLEHFGEDGPERFSEGTVIYINRDNPLYRREARRAETHTMRLARLLTQEITLMKDAPRDPPQGLRPPEQAPARRVHRQPAMTWELPSFPWVKSGCFTMAPQRPPRARCQSVAAMTREVTASLWVAPGSGPSPWKASAFPSVSPWYERHARVKSSGQRERRPKRYRAVSEVSSRNWRTP